MTKNDYVEQAFQAEDYPVVLFDSYCLICEGFIQFLLRADREGILKYAGLDSDASKNEIEKRSIPLPVHGSVVLLLEDDFYIESAAVLEILKITKTYPFIRKLVKLFPSFLRDSGYRMIARNRYQMFRKKDQCILPDPKSRSRFV